MSDKQTQSVRERVIEAIRTVHDPEIPVNVYDLGLIYDVTVVVPDGQAGAQVQVQMTLTTPNCPVAELLPQTVQQKVREVPGVADASIELVWEPAWTPERMSEDAKLALDYDGSPGSMVKKDPFTSLSVGRTHRPKR